MFVDRPRSSSNKLVEAVRKPGSVPGSGYPLPGDGHSSGSTVTGSLKRPTRRHWRATLNASLLGLAPDGVYLASAVAGGPGELLPHPFTLTCRSRRTSLCGTFPWGHPRWTLSSVMPCGARTFLDSRGNRDHLDYFNQTTRLRLKPSPDKRDKCVNEAVF